MFPEIHCPEGKRQVKTLYIDADEDHVSFQYLEEKGDLKGNRGKTFMPRLVYVYEGISTEGNRYELIGARYFGGGYEGTEENGKLWQEVYDYIDKAYGVDTLEQIYINGDGADWIKSGAKMIAKAAFVLDRYHMHHYIIAATSHLGDSVQDARSEIWRAINGKRKRQAAEVFDRILAITESESKQKAVEASKKYILGHWSAIMNGGL